MFGCSVVMMLLLFKLSDQMLDFMPWLHGTISYTTLNLCMMHCKKKAGLMEHKDNGEDYVIMDKLNLLLK